MSLNNPMLQRFNFASKELISILWGAFLISPVCAVDGTWISANSGKWMDADNWDNAQIANGSDATATFNETGSSFRMVEVPADGVELKTLSYPDATSGNTVYIVGGTLQFCADGALIASTAFENLNLSTAVKTEGTLTLQNMTVATKGIEASDIKIAGTIKVIPNGAADTDPLNNFFPTVPLTLTPNSKLALFTKAATNACTHVATCVEGSCFVTLNEDDAYWGAGATVSGEGITEGTFVKHTLDYHTLELSAPALSSGTFELTFSNVQSGKNSQNLTSVTVEGTSTLAAYSMGDVSANMGDFMPNNPFDLQIEKLIVPADATLRVAGGNYTSSTVTFPFSDDFAGSLGLSSVTITPNLPSSKYFTLPSMFQNEYTTSQIILSDADSTLNLKKLIPYSATLIKDGAGTLELSGDMRGEVQLVGNGTYLYVNQGKVILRGVTADNKPATGAYLHVDASDLSTLQLQTVNGTNFVLRWNDASQGSHYANAGTDRPLPY